jgi:hypothetical protein
MMKIVSTRWFLTGIAAIAGLCALPETASAQEILLTGPLAGAPPVRKLRLYREGRFFATPQVSFSLLDEYKRTVNPGLKLTYHFTDWLGVGLDGTFGALQFDTGLTDKVHEENAQRRGSLPEDDSTRRLTAVNLGPGFRDQLGTIDWTAALNITLIPFRGKLSVFDSVFTDTDFYVFLGPAFVGLTERANCGDGESVTDCTSNAAFDTEGRTAITGNFGLGMTFYVDRFNSFFLEWKGLPVSRSIAGFDVAGSGPEGAFPDNQFNDDDRSLRFNQFLTVGWNFALPLDYRVSE